MFRTTDWTDNDFFNRLVNSAKYLSNILHRSLPGSRQGMSGGHAPGRQSLYIVGRIKIRGSRNPQSLELRIRALLSEGASEVELALV